MSKIHIGPDVFSMDCDLIDVTSNHRPNVGYVITDKTGHAHPWCGPDGQPAKNYNPSVRYSMPSLVWVKGGEEYWDGDDEPYDVGHHECRICGEHIEPPYTADMWVQHIAGLRHYRINSEEVMTREEFERRFEEAKRKAGQ